MQSLYSRQFKEAYDQGNALYLKCDFFEAIRYFDKAIEIEPENPAGYYGLGLVFARLSDWDEAIEQNKKAIARNPGMYEAFMNLGQAYAKKAAKSGDKECRNFARDAHAQALRLNPSSTTAKHCLAFDEWKCANDETAADLLEEVLAKDPKNRQARQLLASIYLLRGRFPQAWRTFLGVTAV